MLSNVLHHNKLYHVNILRMVVVERLDSALVWAACRLIEHANSTAIQFHSNVYPVRVYMPIAW